MRFARTGLKASLSCMTFPEKMELCYSPIPRSIVEKIRIERRDDFGHEVRVSMAGETGYGPCRCCLRQFQPGEKRLLFSYAPVGGDNPYDEVGPVYIHEACAAYDQPNRFPAEVKSGRLPIRLVLRSYNADREMIAAQFVRNNEEVEEVLRKIFQHPEVSFVHVRNATFQCFIAAVRRHQGTGS